jgi:hypothetical protein
MKDKAIESVSGGCKAQGEDKPGMNLVEVMTTIAKPVAVNFIGGSTAKGSPIKGGQN